MRLFVLLFAALGCLAQTPTDWQGWLNSGVRAFKSARYQDAVAAFQRAVDLNPTSVDARLYLGTAYMQQFIPGSGADNSVADRAIAEFRHVLALQPENGVALASIASLHLNMRQFNDARASYQRILTADPNNREAHYSLGYIAWSEFYPAYTAARKNAGMRPEDPGPLANPATRAELRNRWWRTLEEGIWHLTRALEIDPRYDDAMAYMNLLIRERADLRDAPAEYRQDIATADEWVNKTLERQKAQQHVAARSWPGALAEPSSGGTRIRMEASVAQNNLLSQPPPLYPALARQGRIQGTVRMDAVIGKDGRVVNIMVLSGHPLLVPAALEAVKQRVYRPIVLNGEIVEVVANVEVPFTLSN